VMGAVALLQLVEAEETLPFGARLGVRRVRSKATSKPFTINWANLGSNKKSPRKEKQIQKFPFPQVTPNPLSSSYLPPPDDLDYGEDVSEAPALDDIPSLSIGGSTDDSFEPVFDIPIDLSEEEVEVGPPVINPNVPGVIINPVSPSPASDDTATVWSISGPTVWSVGNSTVSTGGSTDSTGGSTVSIGGSTVSTGKTTVSTVSTGGLTVSTGGSNVPTDISTGSVPVSLVPGPWVTVSQNDPLPLQPGPWIPVSNLPDPQEFTSTTVFIDNPNIQFTPFQDPINEDFYNPSIQNFEPVFQNFNPIIQNFDPVIQSVDPVVQNFDPIIQNVDPVVQNFDTQIQNFDPTIQIVDPAIQNFDPVIQNFDTQIQNFDPVVQNFDTQIQNIDPIIQNVDPVNIEVTQEGVTSPQCQTITETIVEQERETRCRIIGESSCYKANLDTPTKACVTKTVEQCEDVVEPQFQEICSDNLVNSCENVIETYNRNICNFVNQTVCEQVEETWYKDECQYEVVYEEVCSTNYVTVRYKTECQYEVELPQETGQDSEATAQVAEKPSYKPQGQEASSGEAEEKPAYILPQADRLPKKTEADRLPKKAFPPRLRVPSSNSRTPRSAPESPRVPRFAFNSARPTPRPRPRPTPRPRPQPCKKVPVREPVQTCKNVPRDDEVCKQVPVVRQVPKCQQQERVLCEAQPYQLQVQRCQLINSPVCSTEEAGEDVRRVCQDIPTEICELEAEAENSDEDSSEESDEKSCDKQEWPLRVCETRLIPVTKTVQREECNGDIFPSASESRGLSDNFSYPSDFYQTTFL